MVTRLYIKNVRRAYWALRTYSLDLHISLWRLERVNVCSVQVCVAVYVPTPCPVSPLPSGLLAWLLSVGNEEERPHSASHTLSPFLSLQQPSPSAGSLSPRTTLPLSARQQLICPCHWVSTSKAPSQTASPMNLLSFLLVFLFFCQQNLTVCCFLSSNSWMLPSHPK